MTSAPTLVGRRANRSKKHEALPQTTLRAGLRVFGLGLALATLACATPPEAFPARLEAALATEDPAQVERLLTTNSRPLFRAMVAADPRAGSPFAVRASKRPTEVVAVQQGEAGGVTLTVRAGGVTRDWVLVREDGDLRLDMMATSARRAWSSP